VDVENKDTSQFIKVFVEAFDAGPFEARKDPVVTPPRQGFLPVPGSYLVEFGQTNFNVTRSRPCTSSTQCFDEEYAGCGVCGLGAGASEGSCTPSPSAKSSGEDCTKPCECGQGLVCRRGLDGLSRCTSSLTACTDGTPYNTCKFDGALYCTPYGDLVRACGGPDAVPSSAYASPEGQPAVSFDCQCPFSAVCRGDGTCAAPTDCSTTIYGLRPGEVRTLECSLRLKSPETLIQDTTANIQLRTFFRKRLQVDDTLRFLGVEEFRRQENLGQVQRRPQAFSAGDQNVQVAVSYSKAPPFVSGEKELMRIEIKSIGGGRVYTINPSDIVVGQPGDKIKCSLETPLRSDRGEFPPITCEVDVGQVAILENYPFSLNVYYDYEVRQSLQVPVQKV
jgi:hypothetical protein